MSAAERARAANVEAWRVHTRAVGGEVIERDGIFTCFTGAPHAMWNPSIALDAGFSAALPALEKEYEARGVQFGFLTDDRHHTEGAEAADRLGLHHNDPSPVMVLHPIPDLDPPGHEVRLVEDPDGLDVNLRIQAAGFGQDIADLRAFSPPRVLDSDERPYLALDEGVPAATSILIVTGAEGGIFGVATHPDHRRRGLGRAATVAAIRDAAAAGCDLVYLQASEMGYPVYAGLGFRTVETNRTFVRATGQQQA